MKKEILKFILFIIGIVMISWMTKIFSLESVMSGFIVYIIIDKIFDD